MRRLQTIMILALAMALVFSISAAAENTLIADTGFRVEKDGFGFANYGSQVCSNEGYSFFPSGSDCYTVQNLTSTEMVRMFGNQVCKNVKKDGTCVLTKVAESWMDQINQIVANGHCEGMAVLSSLFYAGIENPKDFGSSVVNDLELKGNDKLQRELAYWFTTQWFMDDYLIEDDPASQLKYLQNAFQKNPDVIIPIGIYQRDLSGGHAIAAYAIVEKGNGIYYIMVYDNNYPDEQKYITVNTKKNTWSYVGSTNPWVSAGSYEGKGNSNPFQIAPIEPRLGTFKCDFCTEQSSSYEEPETPYTYPTSSPDDSSDDYQDIWDVLSPWLNPDDNSSSSDSTDNVPTAAPDDSSDSYQDIWDILSPWLSPYISPTESYTQPTSSAPIKLPTQTPPSYDDLEATQSAPLIRPTAQPTASEQDAESESNTYNKISVNSAINIYIETDDDKKAGYDWEKDQTYDEINGVEISKSMGRSSARLPNDLKYYLWMNSPDEKDWKTFDATITSPGRFLNLTNIPESYEYPNFVYSPPTYVKDLDIEFEFFEIMAYPEQLPGVEFVISDEYGEYSFKFKTALEGSGRTPDAQIDFAIFHNYDEGEVGIWISAVDDADNSKFNQKKFVVDGDFTLYDNSGEVTLSTADSEPVTMGINGMFYFNYLDWQNGKGFNIEADLDGDDEYETNRTLK